LVNERERLAELYRASDLFVFPSRREGLPNVVLEAMASGLPVIISNLPVLENVIANGANGLIVPIDDLESLKVAIVKLNNDPLRCQQLGQRARSYIEFNHGFKTWQTELTIIYKRLLIK